jgi:hypothetical protein
VLSLYPPPEKLLAYTQPPKKNLGPKMGKFGQKMSFLGNFLTNPRDFHKSAGNFMTPSSLKFSLDPPPPPRFWAGFMYEPNGTLFYNLLSLHRSSL